MNIPISTPNDSRIAAYRMVKERDLVGRNGLFIAEGEVVLRLLLRSPLMETLSILITDKRLAGLSEILAPLADAVPVYTASQEVMDSIVGFPIHRGILALGRRRQVQSVAELLEALPARCIVLALIGIANHDNMGGIFRNAAAFGVNAVIADAASCDPLYRKSIRVSVGAALTVPFARLMSTEDLLELLERFSIKPLALSPLGKTRITELKVPARTSLLLGAEGAGLPDTLMARCQTVSIPMAKGFDSLNVATTSGIVLHQLTASFESYASRRTTL